MKLVEIKDVRVGQIRKVTAYNQWKDEEEFEVLAVIEAAGIGEYAEFDNYAELYDIQTKQLIEDDSEELRFYEDGELIGKLGITHRIEDSRLVEIPRSDGFKVDDVVRHESGKTGVIVKTNNAGFAVGYEYSINCGSEGFNDTFEYLTKIGILGVTHEFVNDREGEQ